jgi:hypothetical protein
VEARVDRRNPYKSAADSVLVAVPVDAFEVLQRAWSILMGNVALVAAVALIPAVVFVPFGAFAVALVVVATQFDGMATPAFGSLVLLGLVGAVIGLAFVPGTTRIATKLARGEPAAVGMLLGDLGRLPSVALLAALTWAITTVGYGVCFVPGLVASMIFGYAPFVLIDQEKGAVESLVDAWNLTLPHLLMVFVLEVALGLMVAASSLTCGLALLVVVPFGVLARAVMFQALLGASGRF